MLTLSIRRNVVSANTVRKTLQKFYATSIEPLKKNQSQEDFDKELKQYDRLTNIVSRTRQKRPQRGPFVKNLLIGVYDREILTFPELDLKEYKNLEAETENLKKLLQQKHMVNVDSLGNKNFRQNLVDHKAIGLQASQFLDARECCPLETVKFLETLSEHKLRDSIIHNEMLGVQALNRFAADTIKKKYLYPVILGEKVTAFALNESNLSDLNKMNTKATLSDDNKYWILNGKKNFVVNGMSADYLIVFAISDSVILDKETDNSLTAFVVEKDTPGVSWTKMEPSNVEVAEICFDNVQIPVDNIVGKPHLGERVLKSIIRDFRLSVGPACVAISRKMVNNLYQSLLEKNTKEFNLMATDAVKGKLGEVSMELYAAESVAYFTAGLMDWYENQDLDVECSIVKVLASEAAYRISTTCLDLLGHSASLTNHWAKETHEDVLNYLTLYETNDSQRLFIALNGLQYAGIHLANKIKKIRNPFFNFTYMMTRIFTENHQNIDNPKLNHELFTHLHPSCEEPSKQLEYCCKRLEFVTELLLARNGVECVNKHVHLRHLADIMIECYTMTAMLARASRSYCIGLQCSEFEVTLASVYINMATERVREHVRNLFYTEYLANERNHICLGKRFVDYKKFFIESPVTRFF